MTAKRFARRLPWLAALLLAGAASPAAGQDKVTIGIAAALTGEFALYSESQGAQCMADKLNAAAGPDDPRVEVLVEDSRSEAQLSVSIGQKFIDQGAQVVAGVPFPDALIPLSQVAAASGVTVFSAPNTQVEMQESGLDNFIAGAVPDPINAAAAAEAAYAKGARRALLLVSPDAGSFSEKLPEWFGEAFEKAGGTVVGKLNYSYGTSDWAPQIADIKAMGEQPDVIHLCAVLPDAGILVRQLAASGYTGWVAGCDGFDDPSLEQTVANDEALNRVLFATHGVTGTGGPVDQFMEECKKSGHDVNGIFDALGADMVSVVHSAAKKAGTSDPNALREAIRAPGGHPGVTSPTISFAEKRGYPTKPVPVIGFENGKRVVLQETVPGFIPHLQ